jgi:hypothetical protein
MFKNIPMRAPLPKNVTILQNSSSNDNPSNSNDIRADFEAALQICCTTIYGWV